MSTIEIIAVIFGLACVWFSVKQNIWTWPTGLVQVSLYIVIFWRAKLYSDMLLQVVYVFLQIYGWHAWLHGGPERTTLPVTRLAIRSIGPWTLLGLTSCVALGTVMHRYTDASFPFVDAFATVASLIAQWWMARKILESWLVWIVVDIVSIGLYLAKELNMTAGLYAVFLGMATFGWLAWRNAWKNPAMA